MSRYGNDFEFDDSAWVADWMGMKDSGSPSKVAAWRIELKRSDDASINCWSLNKWYQTRGYNLILLLHCGNIMAIHTPEPASSIPA
jgi:hypothetical protein